MIDKEIRKICVESAPLDGIKDGISREGKNILPCNELLPISEHNIFIQNVLSRARAVINEEWSTVDCADKMILQPSIIDASIPSELQLPIPIKSSDEIDVDRIDKETLRHKMDRFYHQFHRLIRLEI